MNMPDLPFSARPSAATARAGDSHRLAADGLWHSFGDASVLRDVSLSLAPGEILCLVGPSGCGKSTLLRLLAGLERVQRGSIALDGKVIADASRHVLPEKRGVGMVFQDFALFPHLSLLDNVAFGLAGRPAAQRRARALEMLAQVGLADRAQDAPHALSGGQQQRVALARALAPQPRLMLLDEPFSNLDVRLRHRLRAETRHLLKEGGVASVMVTHDPDEAMFMADRIALMRAGRILQAGSPAELYRHPGTPFAAGFFGEVNRYRGCVRAGRVATPLGEIAAPGLAEGAQAEVLLRPEAIHPLAAGTPGGFVAEVVEAHMLGAYSQLTLALPDGRGGRVCWQAQMPSAACPAASGHLTVGLYPDGVFVFPPEAEA